MPPARLAPDVAAFYSTQSAFTDPGDLAPLYADLPRDPGELARVARGLMIHRGEGGTFGYATPPDRLHNDAETRYLDDILRIVVERNDAPLSRRREPEDRFVGVCRDFALLHCSLLRHVGVPARLRSGFASYFGSDGFHSDHVVTEYWDPARGWLLADPQLPEPLLMAEWGIDFDPMDVPRHRFLVAGKVWRAIRAGDADPRSFGLHPPEEGPMFGEFFVAGNVRLDLAALNKVETLLWDVWGSEVELGRDLTDEVRARYDRAAPVSDDEVSFAEARRLFATDEEFRTPATVMSYAPFNGPREVALR